MLAKRAFIESRLGGVRNAELYCTYALVQHNLVPRPVECRQGRCSRDVSFEVFGDDSGNERERGETTLDDSTRVRCTVMCRLCTRNDHQLLGHAHQTEKGSDS